MGSPTQFFGRRLEVRGSGSAGTSAIVPSEYVIRDLLIRINPQDLNRALLRWNDVYGRQDENLAIDGKTMCNALDDQGYPTHVMSVIGHQTKTCYTQKKWVPCP